MQSSKSFFSASKMSSLVLANRVLDSGKCEDVVHYHGISNYLVSDVIVATATSERHCKAIGERLEEALKDNNISFISSTSSSDVANSNDWVVIDCEKESLMIHIMTEEKRDYYKIDQLISQMSKGQAKISQSHQIKEVAKVGSKLQKSAPIAKKVTKPVAQKKAVAQVKKVAQKSAPIAKKVTKPVAQKKAVAQVKKVAQKSAPIAKKVTKPVAQKKAVAIKQNAKPVIQKKAVVAPVIKKIASANNNPIIGNRIQQNSSVLSKLQSIINKNKI
ncbi:ribosome silencing factor [Candidatus Deianiraea vastatrix]|uniref:Ribosomal silencing factor RsfS n=1 Tax=Candidatus Deianiraea vastatrix TaxID=2163644 RepID=A0A5B8XKS0_9RICK|nr:ribosome silencing factor [Candidatus Deianiraea vastatrix]QED23937.1 Ribosomal silencing factor RsfS [Candidatus Deianiraea vastatrix]